MINNLRWLGVLGAVYVAFAAVGVAQATGPDDRPGPRGPGALAASASQAPVPDVFMRAVARATPATVIHADDRNGLRGEGRIVVAVPRLPGSVGTDGRFAWGDAALSALVTLAMVALVGAGAVNIRYRKSPKLS